MIDTVKLADPITCGIINALTAAESVASAFNNAERLGGDGRRMARVCQHSAF